MRLEAGDHDPLSAITRVSLITGSLTIILILVLWLFNIGWPQRQLDHIIDFAITLTQKAHFAVTDIQVIGRQHVAKDQISSALNIGAGAPILAFDTAAAAARIAKLPWVGTVVIERRLPDNIIVHLTERTPLARWQRDNHTVVVDENGRELPEATPEQFANLPLVVGAGAAVQAKTLLSTLKDYPAVTDKITAATWVGLRRWDIYLSPKIIVRMPEGGLEDGLKRLTDLIVDKKILDMNIVGIDLRFPDRVITETGGTSPATTAGETRL
jgi:cell division protein FtsQ